jgi:hypothetical protein
VSRRFAAVLAAGFAAATARAEAAQIGAAELNLPLSVREMGMGGVSVGDADAARGWSNPAVLADLAGAGEIAGLGGSHLADMTMFGLAGAYRFNDGLVGGVLLGRYALSAPAYDEYGEPAGDRDLYESRSVGLAGGWRSRWFRAGLAVKRITEGLVGDQASAMAADAGVAGRWGPVDAGLAARNVGGNLREEVDPVLVPKQGLPAEFRLGAGYRLERIRARAALEVAKVADREATAGLGVEWWAARDVGLRLGGRFGKGHGRLAAGLTGRWRGLSVDYAFSAEALGVQHRAGISYTFQPAGGGAEPERRESERRESPAPAPRAEASRLNFAVADLRGENVSAGDAAVIADLLRSELVKTGAFNVVEKQNMDKVLAEHAFQQTGCTTEECAVKLGKLLNVQRMAVGSFGKLLDSYFVNIRVVNVETGAITFGDSAEGKNVTDLKAAVRNLARRMAEQVR